MRDPQLLDALELLEQQQFQGRVWRSMGGGRDPRICWRSGGRWDDGSFDVLYTSLTRETAIAERRFHLYRGQPIPPSKLHYELFELSVSLAAVMTFDTLDSLAHLGMDRGRFGQLTYASREQEYRRSQEIAEACFFLGADGLLVPSARDLSQKNLIIFCEQETDITIEIHESHGLVDVTA